MLTIDCKDVSSVQNELLVYVADRVEAIPTLKNQQFTLSTLDDDDVLDIEVVISAIKEYFDSINEGPNFAVISKNEFISITSVNGKCWKVILNPKMEICFHVLIAVSLLNIKLN